MNFRFKIGKLGKRILKRKFNHFLPPSVDKWLRYARYLVLAWVVSMTAMTGTLVFEAYDPYYALFNLWSSEVAISGLAILAAVLVLSLFVERPFCKYACPYGAVLGVFNLFRIFGIKRNPSTCTSCKACDRACPMNITVSTRGGRVRNHQCITCLECTSEKACPVAKTVQLGIGRFDIPRDAPIAAAEAGSVSLPGGGGRSGRESTASVRGVTAPQEAAK